MKTVFKNHQEVCHVWASRSQDSGRAGNISFDKDVLLSYHWWPMAKFINDNTVLVRNCSYSSSTSKHLNYMYRAIPDHYKQISCNEPAMRYGYETDHNKNIADFQAGIKNCFDKFQRSKKFKQYEFNNQLSIINNMVDYCNLFNLLVPDFQEFSLNKDIYLSEIVKQDEHLKLLEFHKETIRLKLIAEYGTEIKAMQSQWINGTTNQTHIWDKKTGYIHFDKTYLRVKDDTIQTSLGANVPLREAEILYRMIQRQDNIKGHRIGNYTVIGLNGKLKIGCHEIDRDEITRIAQVCKW